MRSSKPEDVLTPETIMSSTSFLHLMANLRRFVSSRRSSEDEMFLVAKDSRNCARKESVRHVLVLRMYLCTPEATYHLQLILPELLLPGLVEKGKVANMVDKDVTEDWKLRVEGRDLTDV